MAIEMLSISLTNTQAALILAAFLILIILHVVLYRIMSIRISKASNEQLLKEKEILEQLFNSIPDRIYFKDRESRFILANKHVSMIMGEKNPRKLIGKTDFDFYDEKFASSFYEDEQKIMKEGIPMIAKEEKGLDIEGKVIYVSTTKIPIKDSKNKVIGIVGIGRDISLQKEAEENLRETNVLLEERQEEIEQMAEELSVQADNLKHVNAELEYLSLVASKTENTVIIMDGNGNFEWVNAAFEQRYGMNLEDFVNEKGKNIRDNSSYENISAAINQIYITKKPFSYSSKFTGKDGKESWSQTNISPILDSNNDVVTMVLIDSDISELKLAEQRIKKQKAEIESKSKELKRLNTTKDRIFSIIGHDLKNPFHSILGFTEVLLKQYKDIEREKLNELLNMINSSGKVAYQLLENLLEWARAQTKNVKFEPEKINVHKLVEEVIQLQSLQASEKNLEFINDTDAGLTAFADRNMLNTVIRNLANNAIKFTEEGGKISFSGKSGSGEIHLEISDTGIGIAKEKLDQLFDLEKVESTAGTAGEAGTGLGLLVCYEFMQINNGAISVSSAPGKGSTFKLTLPDSG